MTVEPADLYTVDTEVIDGLGEPVLLVALDGYVDAGNGVQQVVQRLTDVETGTDAPGSGPGFGPTAELAATTDPTDPADSADGAAFAADPAPAADGEQVADSLAGRTVVSFDADLLIDYRSRRPMLTYADGEFVDYDDPALQIRRLVDTAGTPYLLLSGPEPDVLWERFVQAVIDIAQRLNVRQVVSLLAIPMGVPHTRPASMSKHSSTEGLVPSTDAWMGTMQVPGHVAGLLEMRLSSAGIPAIGLAAHVPHYLARSNYPLAAQQLLRTTGELSNLELGPEKLNAAIGRFDTELATELQGNAEVAQVVKALEEQYDTFVSASGRGLLATSGPLPTADELGAEFEAFLAEQDPGSGR